MKTNPRIVLGLLSANLLFACGQDTKVVRTQGGQTQNEGDSVGANITHDMEDMMVGRLNPFFNLSLYLSLP